MTIRISALVIALTGAGPCVAQSALLPQVVDSAGKPVGYLISTSAVVLTPAGKPPLVTQFYATGFLEPAGNQYFPDHYFTSTDCSGRAYLLAASMPLTATVNPTNDKFFEYPGTPAKAAFHSIKHYYNNSPPTCTGNLTTTLYAGPSTALSITGLGFKPPFSVRFD